MAIVWNRQYRPISVSETYANDPVSVRSIRDLADSINNYRCCVGNFKVIFEIFQGGFSSSITTHGDTEESVCLAFSPIFIPEIYDTLIIHIGHQRTDDTGNPRWRFRLLDRQFSRNSSNLFVYANYPVSPYCQWTSSSSTHTIDCKFITNIRHGGTSRPIYPILTVKNNGGEAKITTLDVTPIANFSRVI